ncbi:carbamoyltransferase [Aquimarina sp. 2201CG5-10]|uniref:carbamoyltransferase family protein n=1 Tax=Aquimarina callyspongiae TaxID=3098150 RepID=UPI002AB3FC9C|nr:carbamoyltransferase [Aquimarina sp. 2201CG5-10]MDY8138855.1 carbamoyltransferase [Aquimarina sp. 2201CG5-10]
MSTYILGISAFYHDSAACLLKDGQVISAIQEERLSRKKHDAGFPQRAIDYCLSSEKITIDDISLIAFYEKPFMKFERIIDSYSGKTPFGFRSFKKAIKSWTSEKLWIPNIIQKKLNYKGEIIYTEHHEAHAASAFFVSPFKESTILTIDGVGERASITIAKGFDNKINIISEQQFPHSLGLFYSAFTYYCGFKVNSGEYKLMGLAPYGKSIYKDLIYKHFITVDEKGVLTLNMKYFNYEVGLKMTNNAFNKVMGQPARKSESKMSQFYKDVARSAQEVLEEIVIKLARSAKEITGLENLCMAGGVALNCKANQELLKQKVFKNIWVQPASGDCGGALGAALIGHYHYQNNTRNLIKDSPIHNAYLGNSFTDDEIENQLQELGVQYNRLSPQTIIERTAAYLNNKHIIGWFQGKMEFGPRALGSRSILASPKYQDMQSHLNLKIKKREGFRPFAPIVIEDKANEWFDIKASSKYMLFTFNVKKPKEIPSCTHLDNTARVQTVNKEDNTKMYELLSQFEKLSGLPILINTSFNVRGEPIVATVEDAVRCFFNTDMDILVIGNCIVAKDVNSNFDINTLKEVTYELD